MTRKTPLFITASLLVATLALALPDLDLETAGTIKDSVKALEDDGNL